MDRPGDRGVDGVVAAGVRLLESVYAIRIPKGTTIYEGPAGFQSGIYLGGGDQIYIARPWELDGAQVVSETPIGEVTPSTTPLPIVEGSVLPDNPIGTPNHADGGASGGDPPGSKSSGDDGPSRVSLANVRYTQKTAQGTLEDGTRIDDVAAHMRQNGWDYTTEQPNMVDWGDGYATLDHRRLIAANRAGLQEVGANVHLPDEPLPASQLTRFENRRNFTDPVTGESYRKGQFAQTWGEAALFRAAKQGGNFPIRGHVELPIIRDESQP